MSAATRSVGTDRSKREQALDPLLALVLERVRARAARRIAWLRTLWNGELSEMGASSPGHSEIDAHLENRDAPQAESLFYRRETGLEKLNAEIRSLDEAVIADDKSRFAQLVRLFGLSAPESDLLQACIAVALDPHLARVFAYLQDHAGRPFPTEPLVVRLFGHGHGWSWSAESSLRLWSLVRSDDTYPGEPAALRVDPSVLSWLLGRHDLDPALAGVARLVPIRPPLAAWPVDATAEQVKRLLESNGPIALRIAVAGAVGAGRRTFAACVATRLGLGLLAVEADGTSTVEFEERLRLAQRQAFLDSSALAWHGEAVLEARWASRVPRFPVQFVVLEPDDQLPPAADWVDLRVDLPGPSLEEQVVLWRRQLGGGTSRWKKAELETLLSRQQLSVGDIAIVAHFAPRGVEEAAEAIASLTRQRMTSYVQILECPFESEDLVLPDHLRAQLEEVRWEAQDRRRLWEEDEIRRLFPLGRGLVAVFAGPSGAGKTMSAQVIARSLHRPLFKVNTAAVVSRYVGDSSKRIRKILSRAAQVDALVLFDECEAFFSKRTDLHDAHDRYANSDTDDLLMAIESYPGVALLCTSRKADIDRAFFRRIRYVLDFPRPGVPERVQLWTNLLSQMGGPAAQQGHDAFLKELAALVDVTGAEVKQAILNAVFAARRERKPLTARHVLHGLERELVKQGRSLGERERRRLLGHAA